MLLDIKNKHLLSTLLYFAKFNILIVKIVVNCIAFFIVQYLTRPRETQSS